MFAVGCASEPLTEEESLATLSQPAMTSGAQMRAMKEIEGSMDDPAVVETLYRVMWKPGYTQTIREEALVRLEAHDLAGLKRSIRQNLPRETAWGWLTRVCEIIADRGWIDLSPALVSSWSRPSVYVREDMERPEYKALVKLYGEGNVVDAVFALFVESTGPQNAALRTRCWDLLHRLGQRDRMVALLNDVTVAPDDSMLMDLRAGAVELGIVPVNKEEVLWLRKLREPSRAEFWTMAVAAVQSLPPERKAELELRDLPIIVSASVQDPELFSMTRDELYARVDAYTRGQKHYARESNYDNLSRGRNDRLYEYKNELTWGDLAAMLIAIRALEVPQVVDHIIDYANRDKEDTSTEFGGVIALDGKNRFEILEFPPMVRDHDNKYISSQAMLDAGYTAIFHFHLHAQKFRNVEYAGPELGDMNYADNTRANCLVFTFVNEGVMNVDYYRHGRVVIDLGVISNK
jgi:hypothetical protein